MIVTSHDKLGNTGEKTGFLLEEFAAPYYVFKDAGAEVTLASPLGGQPPLDPKSDAPDFQTEVTHRFKADSAAQNVLSSTLELAEVSAADFDALFYLGGHGPLCDLAEDMLKQNGGKYSKQGDSEPHVVPDGLLITGQNPASSESAAKVLLAKLT